MGVATGNRKQTNTTSQNYHQFNSLLTICPEQ